MEFYGDTLRFTPGADGSPRKTFAFTSDLTAYVPTSRTLTINGTALDLSANRSWSVGTVTSVSANNANGFTFGITNATTTPSITLSTSVNGMVKGNGTALSAATAGTDYSIGTGSLATGLLKSTTSTGALTIATGSDISSTFGSYVKNLVFASPSGTSGVPILRYLVAEDIPALPYDNYSRWTFGYINETGGGGTNYINSNGVLKIQTAKPLSASFAGSGTSGDPYILNIGFGTGQAYLNYSATSSALIVGSGRTSDGLICGNLASGTYNLLALDYGGANKIRVDNTGAGFFAGDVSVSNEAYGSGWNGSTEVPTKDAIFDKVESITSGATYSATVSLSSAQILSLNTSPITVVTAPGAGYAIEVISCSFKYTFVTAPYTGYVGITVTTDTSGSPQFAFSNTLGGSSNFVKGEAYTPATNYSNLHENGALKVTISGGNPTGGSGTGKLYVIYRIITL